MKTLFLFGIPGKNHTQIKIYKMVTLITFFFSFFFYSSCTSFTYRFYWKYFSSEVFSVTEMSLHLIWFCLVMILNVFLVSIITIPVEPMYDGQHDLDTVRKHPWKSAFRTLSRLCWSMVLKKKYSLVIVIPKIPVNNL